MKKFWKIMAFIVAIALIIGVCCVANALVGNPLSKMLAEKGADRYLAEHYAGTDYYISDFGFNFKDTNYYANIRSDTSVDTQFTIYMDMIGRFEYDTYEDVTSGAITASRLYREYRALTDQIFKSPTYPYSDCICFGSLEFYCRESLENPNITDIPDYALLQDDLIPDKVYDIKELGAQAGRLVVYAHSTAITMEEAARILLYIREEFDAADIPFRVVDFKLSYPRTEDKDRPDDIIWIEAFRYEDIYAEGLVERIEAANAAREEYYADWPNM